MQFLIIAHDGEDDAALDRRLAARADHLALVSESVKDGRQLMGAAILDDAGKMRGSVMLVNYPSRKEVDEWLKNEPYVVGNVWKKIDVIPCQLAPSFTHLLKN